MLIGIIPYADELNWFAAARSGDRQIERGNHQRVPFPCSIAEIEGFRAFAF